MPKSLLLGVLRQGLALTFSASIYQMLGFHARTFLQLGINKKFPDVESENESKVCVLIKPLDELQRKLRVPHCFDSMGVYSLSSLFLFFICLFGGGS